MARHTVSGEPPEQAPPEFVDFITELVQRTGVDIDVQEAWAETLKRTPDWPETP